MRISKEIRQLIGTKLKEERIKRKETQRTVSQNLGLSRQMVNRYEKGHDAPTADNLAKALRYFGTSIDLPGYRLTAEALEVPAKPGARKEVQFEMPFGKPQEILDATVRLTRERDSLEIVISRTSGSAVKS